MVESCVLRPIVDSIIVSSGFTKQNVLSNLVDKKCQIELVFLDELWYIIYW